MRIKTKLAILSLALTIIPMLFLAGLLFYNAKKSLEKEIFNKLEGATALKAAKIETFFSYRKADLLSIPYFYNIRVNIPILEQYKQDRINPIYLKAKEMLDEQLRPFQEAHNYADIMLLDKKGNIVYASNPEHASYELDSPLPGPEKAAFEKVKDGFYIGDVFKADGKEAQYMMIMASPVLDFENNFIGIAALEVDMEVIYKLIRDKTGLGETGETLLVKRISNDKALFLNPLLYDADAALKKEVIFGSDTALPAQKAALGEHGCGFSVDYRGKEVLSCWRAIPLLGWGIVAKVDRSEAFIPIAKMRQIAITIFVIALILVVVTVLAAAKSISDPIHKLHEGTEIIGKGNWDYKVGQLDKDEIGQLSRAFDEMTENLKHVTASRDELDREIVERKKMEQALRESKAWFSTTLKSIGDGLIATDSKGRVIFINPVAEVLTGWREEEAKGLFLKDIFNIENEETGRKLEDPVAKVIREGTVVGLANHTILITKSGTRRPIDDSAAPIRDSEGDFIGVVLIFRDITERRNTEKKVQETVEMKSAFTSMVSHELRTPLGALKESISLVSDGMVGGVNQEQKRFLDIARNNVDRLSRLINEVLDFQTLDAGKMPFEMKDNDINQVVRETKETMSIIAKEKGLDFVLNLDESLPAIRFDRDRISQVLSNLVSNSLKLTEKGGVTITTSQKGDEGILVSVKDTGPGIKEEDMPRLFRHYEQLERRVGGTGLGLAISLQIIKVHGGRIWAESRFGEGTTFYFVLPAKKEGVA